MSQLWLGTRVGYDDIIAEHTGLEPFRLMFCPLMQSYPRRNEEEHER